MAPSWRILACDYDGTLVHHGVLAGATAAALDRFRNAGGRLVMVTGRELPDLQRTCGVLDRFERIVAENGALLYRPSDGSQELLCAEVSVDLAKKLAAANVSPLSVGKAIIGIHEPHQAVALELIRELGLELQIIFNKGAVMILPTGVNKATGLAVALAQMKAEPNDVVAVGDAENDHALLSMCGLGVAVGNAIEALKESADFVTVGARGEGVAELIDRLLEGELTNIRRRPAAKMAPVNSTGRKSG